MTAYHVSKEQYEIGVVISNNNYFDVTLRRGNEWVEKLLENYRPKSCPNRLKCVFSFEKIEALGYYSDLLSLNNLQFYEVELLSYPCKSPMVLCEYIQKNRNNGQDLLAKLAIEYWGNTMNWNFLELLSDSFKIVDRLNRPNISKKVIGMGMYKKDETIAGSIK
jgi:hypothetical protein